MVFCNTLFDQLQSVIAVIEITLRRISCRSKKSLSPDSLYITKDNLRRPPGHRQSHLPLHNYPGDPLLFALPVIILFPMHLRKRQGIPIPPIVALHHFRAHLGLDNNLRPEFQLVPSFHGADLGGESCSKESPKFVQLALVSGSGTDYK